MSRRASLSSSSSSGDVPEGYTCVQDPKTQKRVFIPEGMTIKDKELSASLSLSLCLSVFVKLTLHARAQLCVAGALRPQQQAAVLQLQG